VFSLGYLPVVRLSLNSLLLLLLSFSSLNPPSSPPPPRLLLLVNFTASDGKVFTDRDLYRKYEFALMYTFSNLAPSSSPPPSPKMPGTVDGQAFDISDCEGVTLAICDNSEQVQIDNCDGCKVFVAASSEAIFVRDCKNCTFTIACKQLRTRDCVNCTFYLYSKTEPIIETSTGMKFAPFNGAYPGHEQAMAKANLQPAHNLWFAVYDFNDEAKTGVNWRRLAQEEEEPVWCPIGPAENCCPRVEAGSLALPSQVRRREGGREGGREIEWEQEMREGMS